MSIQYSQIRAAIRNNRRAHGELISLVKSGMGENDNETWLQKMVAAFAADKSHEDTGLKACRTCRDVWAAGGKSVSQSVYRLACLAIEADTDSAANDTQQSIIAFSHTDIGTLPAARDYASFMTTVKAVASDGGLVAKMTIKKPENSAISKATKQGPRDTNPKDKDTSSPASSDHATVDHASDNPMQPDTTAPEKDDSAEVAELKAQLLVMSAKYHAAQKEITRLKNEARHVERILNESAQVNKTAARAIEATKIKLAA